VKPAPVADKYIENEMSIVLIDLILLRRQAYRHLIHNRLVYYDFPQPSLCPSLSTSPSLSLSFVRGWLAFCKSIVNHYILSGWNVRFRKCYV
jgi:hypothetical protein